MLFKNINIVYNYLSFLIVGLSGVLLNIFILSKYNISVLGDFNLSLSFLVILSQFCVSGIQLSILKHNSNFYKKLSEVSHSLSSALLLTALLSIFVISILYFSITFFEIDNFSCKFKKLF